MAYYRLYYFRSQTGHIREVREFEAPHDFAAIHQCAKWRSDEFMELWTGARKVSRWPGTGIVTERDETAPGSRSAGERVRVSPTFSISAVEQPRKSSWPPSPLTHQRQ